MTVTNETSAVQYLGTGTQKIFPYTFLVSSLPDLRVYVNNVQQFTGFTVSGIGNPSGGNVTFTVAPASNLVVALVRMLPLTQIMDYTAYDAFPAESHESALDKLTMIAQQLQSQTTIPLPPTIDANDILYLASGTGAIARSVESKLRDEVDVMDFIPPNLHDAVMNGTIATDLLAYINLALDARARPGSTVTVPSGATLYVTSGSINVGNASATRAHSLICKGIATLKFNLAGHTTDCVVLQGYNQNTIDGRTFYPTTLKGFDINCQNTGRDGVLQKESDMPVRENLTVIQPYRNSFSHVPSANTWIENPFSRNLLASECGHHGFYFGTLNENTFINDGTWINCETRVVAINSVALGIDKVTQANQLGTDIYVISKDATVGGIDGHTWIAHTGDSQSSIAVANGSAPNPYAVFFADGRSAQVIEGAADAGASRIFRQWRFITPRIEDITSGGFTSGTVFGRQNTNVSVTNLWVDALSGGNWGAMSFSPTSATDATYVGSADYAGSIANIRWAGEMDIVTKVTSALGVFASLVGSYTKFLGGVPLGITITDGAAATDLSAAIGNNGGVAFILGNDGVGQSFIDVILWDYFGGTPVVVGGGAVKGAPPVRTYSINGGTGNLALAITAEAGTHNYVMRALFLNLQA